MEVAYHGADMSKPADIRDMVASAQRIFGGLDILVNNAGIQHVAPVEQFPEEVGRHHRDQSVVRFHAPRRRCRHARRKWGR